MGPLAPPPGQVGSALSAACELGFGPQTSPATSLRPSDHMVRQYQPAGSSHQTNRSTALVPQISASTPHSVTQSHFQALVAVALYHLL